MIYFQALDLSAQSVTVKSIGFCCFSIPNLKEITYLFTFIFSFLRSGVTQHAMPPEFDGKWGTGYLNTRFPLPTLLCAGYMHAIHKHEADFLKKILSKLLNFKTCNYICRLFQFQYC